jgi:DNA-binding MarR family transcriptional regulator
MGTSSSARKVDVGESLKKRLKQARFESPFHEAFLNLMVATAHLRDLVDRMCERHRITMAQYNVLRILRGAHPEGYPRCEIAQRMIERAPDVTRLIDRLEEQELVERGRSDADRRLSVTRITRKGLDLLERMQPDAEAVHRTLAARLTPAQAEELSRLCESLYDHD